jgi:hypothetical protein
MPLTKKQRSALQTIALEDYAEALQLMSDAAEVDLAEAGRDNTYPPVDAGAIVEILWDAIRALDELTP